MDKNNKKYLYHATAWSYALDILENGIDHTRGRPCLDFGAKNAFYMTPQLDIALEYCQASSRRWMNECCILVFEIESMHLFDKVYRDTTSDWKNNVKLSRKSIENEFDKYNTVYGPMLYNVNSVLNGSEEPRPHKQIKYQVVSKSTESDDMFDKCLYGIVFFEKQK